MAKRAAKPAKPLHASTRIAVLHGKDRFLQTEHTNQLRAKLEEAHGDVDVLHFDGGAAEVADVLDECRSFGLMQQHKLVVVDSADAFVKDASRAMVERYAESPSDDATLILRCERWHKGKLDKLIDAVGTILKCDAPTTSQALAWSTARCQKRHDATLDPQAAALLVEKLGADLGRIDAELAKLAVGAGPGGTITVPMVAELVGLTREEEVWAIQSVLLAGSAEASIRFIREAIEVSRHPTVLISYACMDLARKLHAAAQGLAQGTPGNELARELKLWGPSRDAVLGAAQRVSPHHAASLLHAAVDADVAQKTGRGDPARTLETLAVRFADSSR